MPSSVDKGVNLHNEICFFELMFLKSNVLFGLNVEEDHVGQNLIDVSVLFGGEELQMFSETVWHFDGCVNVFIWSG